MGCNLSNDASTATKKEDAIPAPEPVRQLTPEEKALNQLRLIFDSVDADHDQSVNKAELAAALQKDPSLVELLKEAGLNQDYDALDQMDSDKDGRLTWQEFDGFLRKAALKEVEETGKLAAADLPAEDKAWLQLEQIFKSLDNNSDGDVDKAELAKGLQEHEELARLVEEAGLNTDFCILDQLDTDADGRISWKEFQAHLKEAAKKQVLEVGDVTAAATIIEMNPSVDEQRGCCSCR